MSDKIENSDTSSFLDTLETFAADKKVEPPAVDFILPDSYIDSVSNINEPAVDFIVPSSISNDVVETDATSNVVPKDTTGDVVIETEQPVDVEPKVVTNNTPIETELPVDDVSADTVNDNITIEEPKPQINIEQTGDALADTYRYAEAQWNANKPKRLFDDQISVLNEMGEEYIEANKPIDSLADSKAALEEAANNNITILDDNGNQEVVVNSLFDPSVVVEKKIGNSSVNTGAVSDASESSLPNTMDSKNTSTNAALADGIKGISAGIVGGLTLAATKLANKVISDDKDSVAQSARNLKSLSLDTKTQESKYNNMVSLLEDLNNNHDGFLSKLDFDILGDAIRKYFDRYNSFVFAVETKNSSLIQADEDDLGFGEWSKAIDASISSDNTSDDSSNGSTAVATIISSGSSFIGGGGTSSSTGGSTSNSSESSRKKKKKKKNKNNNNSDAEDTEELVDESEDIEDESIDESLIDNSDVLDEDVPDESVVDNNKPGETDTSKTPDTSTPSDNQTPSTPSQSTTPQETPSDNSTTPTPSHSLNQQGTASSGSDNYHSGGEYSSSDGYSDTVSTSPEGTDGITDVTESPIEVLDDAPTSIEDVIKDNYTKIPSSSEPITSSTSKGKGTIIPVIAGLSAAAAAGIGAKAYLDRKQNNENEEVEELETDDWSGEEKLDLEYDDNKVPVAYLDDDDDEEDTIEEQQPERYDAKTNEELADLQ